MFPLCCDDWSLFLCPWRRNFFSISGETHWGKVRAGQWHRAWALLGFIITGRGRKEEGWIGGISFPWLFWERATLQGWGQIAHSTQEGRRKQLLEGKTGGTPLFDLESLFAVCDQDSAPQSWSLCLLILALWMLRAPLSFLNTQGCPLSHYCCSLLSQLNRISPVSPLCTKLFSRFLLFLWCICLEEVFSSFQVSCTFFKVHFLLCSAILCLPGWIFSSFIIL